MNTDTKILNLMAETERFIKVLESLPDDTVDADLSDRVLAHIQECKMSIGHRKSDWISVDDKLPERNLRVLIFDTDGFGVLSGRRGLAGWYLEGNLDHNCKITHWQYLPSEPK